MAYWVQRNPLDIWENETGFIMANPYAADGRRQRRNGYPSRRTRLTPPPERRERGQRHPRGRTDAHRRGHRHRGSQARAAHGCHDRLARYSLRAKDDGPDHPDLKCEHKERLRQDPRQGVYSDGADITRARRPRTETGYGPSPYRATRGAREQYPRTIPKTTSCSGAGPSPRSTTGFSRTR